MFLRKPRCLAVGVLALGAVFAGPSRSDAGTEILIQELNSSGVAVGPQQIFNGLTSVNSSTPDFSSVQVIVSPSSLIGSLTTSVNATLATNFSGTNYFQLQITVVSDGFTNIYPGGTANVTNSAGASTTFQDGLGNTLGNNVVMNQTQLLTGINGASLGVPTPIATDILPVPSPAPTRITNNSVSGLPASYAIEQTITLTAQPTNGDTIAAGSTMGDTGGSSVTTVAVPAPGGLLLSLIALPLMSLRRTLRRKATEPTI
jgi:hypothetical protein